jgi:shikimate kinase
VKRVLLTGMSGTGKSTLICALAARGYRAIDADSDEWSEWVRIAGGSERPGSPAVPVTSERSERSDWVWDEFDWVWREDRIHRLLSTEDTDVLFVSGCAANQGKFHAQFDHIVLLSAPARVLMERVATRTTNPYGNLPEERARILQHVDTIEPRLRRVASLEVDTSAPLEQVLEIILDHVWP